MKNDEERWRILTKSLTETSRKSYGSNSAWIFFTETIFLINFERFLNTRRAEHFCSTISPLFIGEKREVVVAQLAQASKVASIKRHRLLLEPSGRPKWVWLLFAHPFFTKYTPFCVFFYWFLSETLWNFTDYATMLVFFLKCCETSLIMQKCSFSFWNVVKLYRLCDDACFEGFEGSKQGSRTDRKYSYTKLGYDTLLYILGDLLFCRDSYQWMRSYDNINGLNWVLINCVWFAQFEINNV